MQGGSGGLGPCVTVEDLLRTVYKLAPSEPTVPAVEKVRCCPALGRCEHAWRPWQCALHPLSPAHTTPPTHPPTQPYSQGLLYLDSSATAALLKELSKQGYLKRAVDIFDWLRRLPSSHDL